MRLPNSYGSIVKLSGKRRRPYAVRITTGWTNEGRQIQKYLSYHTRRADAMAALAEYNKAPFDLNTRKLTFAELYDKWCAYLGYDNVKSVYIYAYKHLTALYDMPFIEIRKRHIQAIIDESTLSPSALNHMKCLCSLVFKYAMDLEIVTSNQASGVKLPAQRKSNIHQPFSADEIDALWGHTDDFAARLALILIYTGLRPSELLQIRTENVNLENHYMRGGLKTAASKNRIIPIADKILPFIRTFYNPASEFLVTLNGRSLTYASMKYYWFKSQPLQDLSIRHLPHDGRHTCATLLANADIDLKTIQMILGHRSSNITEQIYTHKTIDQLLAAINQI